MKCVNSLLFTTVAIAVAPYAMAEIIAPVSATTTVAGDAGSHVDFLLVDNPGFAPAGLQRPAGTGVTLPTGSTLTDALGTLAELSGGGHAESWTFPTTGGNPVLTFDLGTETDIGSILLWQYGNDGGGADSNGNHTREFELIFHTEAEGAAFDFSTEPIEYMATMQRAGIGIRGTTDLNVAQHFSFGSSVSARYVGLRIASNYLGQPGVLAGGDRYGLGEVRFATEVPEPSSLVLVGVGLVGFAVSRRRA